MASSQKASFWEKLRSPFGPCVLSELQKASVKTISYGVLRVCLLWVQLHKAFNRGTETPSGREESTPDTSPAPHLLCCARRELSQPVWKHCLPGRLEPSSAPALLHAASTLEHSDKSHFSPSGNFLQPALLLHSFDLRHWSSSKEHQSIPAAGWECWKQLGAAFITGQAPQTAGGRTTGRQRAEMGQSTEKQLQG